MMTNDENNYTKLQCMLGETLDYPPGHPKVDATIEAMAQWFELLLENMGIQPSSVPALVRWQYWHSKITQEMEEDND
jgi:hypothetical protein